MSTTERENRLARETSPYLRQHAHNPVDWYPWGDEALQRARTEDRPIFLSIGYSSCHWCHVMERESFEDEAIAALMNERFVNIKVDREERPDLDDIYMAATQLLSRQGGWPNSVFLTPELKPFFAGTYFPPDSRHGRPGFREAVRMAVVSLDKMARGGIYDQLGGGFHRYSVDARWLVPHFEKMLYDNALLARTYLEAAQAVAPMPESSALPGGGRGPADRFR